tara:strand:+ start:2604 stop:3938 length:1335 start_codon:yes stop_codon:yes gene_type:complete
MISIIIRTKNEEKWIGQCIESLKNQNLQKFEIIIVDNYSNDNTIKVVKRFNSKNLKIVKIKNFKPGKAINLGIKHSKGDYICILSAHCIPKSKNWLKNLFINLKDNKNVAAVYGKQIPLSFSSNIAKRDLLLTFGDDKRIQKKDYFFHNANSMIKKEILKKFPFSEKVSNLEDRIWAKKIIKKYNIIYEPDAGVYHHHGLHHDNNENRSKGVVSVMENFELNSIFNNDIPNIFNPKKSTITAVMPIKSINSLSPDKKKLLKKTLLEISKSQLINNLILLSDSSKIRVPSKTIILNRKRIKNASSKSIGELLYDVQNIREVKKFYSDYYIFISYDYLFFSKQLIEDLILTSHKNGNDSTFFGYLDFNHYWLKKGDNYEQTDTSTLPIEKRIPLYKALYGLGTIVSSWLIRKKQITGGKIGILPVEEFKYTLRYSKIDESLKKRIL